MLTILKVLDAVLAVVEDLEEEVKSLKEIVAEHDHDLDHIEACLLDEDVNE